MPYMMAGQMVLPERVLSKYKDGQILVKWEPATIAEWKQSFNSGYIVEQYIASPTGEKLLSVQKVKRATTDEWDKAMSGISSHKYDFYRGARDLLYPEKSQTDMTRFLSVLRKKTDETQDSFRLNFLSYVGIYDFRISQLSGLGARFEATEGASYTFKIYVESHPPTEHRTRAVIAQTKVPQLTAEFDDHVAHLKWNTFEGKQYFYGYVLEKSDDGVRYELKDSIPYYTNLDKDPAKTELHFIKVNDSLSQNYVPYHYRLRGMDYFGEYSREYTQFTGFGYDKVTVSPVVYYADQTNDNMAHLKWEVPNAPEKLIKSFTILRADSLSGDYQPVKQDIDKSFREIRIPMEHDANYFRLELVPENGKPMSSMPVFVMGMDTVAPAVPVPIAAVIDSLGRVVLTWKRNTEADLWGIRVFTANFNDEEYVVLNATPTIDTLYADTLDLKFDTKKRFYILQAADKRNNRSPFSVPMIVTKPDKIKPGSPAVDHLEAHGTQVTLRWTASGSDDVVMHRVYRRIVKEEEGWSLIGVIDTASKHRVIIDTTVTVGGVYAYTMAAVDGAGNESKPSNTRMCEIKEAEKPLIPFTAISQKVDSIAGTVTISWISGAPDRLETVVVYKGPDKDRMTRLMYVVSPLTSFTDEIKANEKVVYRLKPSFKEDGTFYVSDIIEVSHLVKKEN